MSRSASGSKMRPKSDSTRQRRARNPSIWSVMPATPNTIPAGQLWPPSAVSISATKTGMSPSRATVSTFGSCCKGAETARVAIGVGKDTPVAESLSLPGFVDAHCHAFQRALRGRSGGGDFWAWREQMLAEAGRQSAELVRREYVEVYRELRAAGYTAVGEFHYLGFEEALAAVEAAEEAGIRIVLLLSAYGRGGLARFRQESVAEYLRQVEELRTRGISIGVAPHSVRACPADWLEEIGRYATAERLPLHVHADEQPREIEECLAEHGLRPIDLLARAGARVCACLTTEANLGDGFLPVERVCTRGIGICIGSDSNVRVDPLEELRELEGIARRQTGRRGVISVEELLAIGSAEGAHALGLAEWADASVDLDHPSLRGAAEAGVYDALVFGCAADVLWKT